ncbi:hypothetical protein HG531_003655 [Fusarium graminearum]|nr:hypothetical protein HG531_003655 [Fusarium graminearum]
MRRLVVFGLDIKVALLGQLREGHGTPDGDKLLCSVLDLLLWVDNVCLKVGMLETVKKDDAQLLSRFCAFRFHLLHGFLDGRGEAGFRLGNLSQATTHILRILLTIDLVFGHFHIFKNRGWCLNLLCGLQVPRVSGSNKVVALVLQQELLLQCQLALSAESLDSMPSRAICRDVGQLFQLLPLGSGGGAGSAGAGGGSILFFCKLLDLSRGQGPACSRANLTQPILDIVGTTEHGSESCKDVLCDVCGGDEIRNASLLVHFWVKGIQLFANLLLRARKGDTVDISHDCLLHNLSGNLAHAVLAELVALLGFFGDRLLDKIGNSHVNISWSISRHEVNLLSTPSISTECCIMLQTVAGTILVHWQAGDIFGGVLEIVFGGKGLSLSKGSLVIAVQVGQVNLEPSKAFLAEFLTIGKPEQSTGMISSHVVQVCRERISTPSIVHVVGEVDDLLAECSSNLELQVHITSLRMKSSALVLDGLDVSIPGSAKKGIRSCGLCWGDQIRCQGGHIGDRITTVPGFYHDVKNVVVDPPWRLSQHVQSLENLIHVATLDSCFSVEPLLNISRFETNQGGFA